MRRVGIRSSTLFAALLVGACSGEPAGPAGSQQASVHEPADRSKGTPSAPVGSPSPATSVGQQDATCSPAVAASPPDCPDQTAAESAWNAVQTTCELADADLDASNLASPDLKPDALPKLCAACACREAVYAYYGAYRHCTSDDQSNAAFAKNLYATASACGS